ncbi:MAG: molybdopterin-dependent oxidoreductase, partial [Chloroflexota bacterium]
MTVATQKIYGVCPLDCPDSCGFVTEVENGRALKMYGAKDHPATQGWLCSKVGPYLDLVYHPDRLTVPLRRTSAKTAAPAYAPITWDEALDEISHKWKAIIDKYGAEAILPYSFSGTLGTLQNYITAARFWNRMGASQLERSICGAAAAHATIKTLGDKLSPPHKDVVHSKVIIIWGHNPASAGPHFMPFLTDAKRKGTKVIVVDPRRTRTAQRADWHIAPKAATDGALAMAMAHVIFKENLHDPEWIAKHVEGGDAYRQHVANCTPEWAAAICDIPAEDIVELARLYATNTPSIIKTADGVQRHTNGGQSFRTMLALPAITGQYGKKGGGFSYSTGGYFKWDWDLVNHWEDCPKPGRWVNMNRLGAALTGEIQNPPIMSLFVFAANPLGATANAGLIQKGLEREDLFTVVHELFMTDTADFADIVLPATSQLEQL